MRFVLFSLTFVCFSHLWGHLMHLGGNFSLECLNDYLFTITCVLNVSSDLLAHSSTAWLEFFDCRQPYKCVLKAQSHSWVCELDFSPLTKDTFTDTDLFQISLNSSYHGNSSSAVLEEFYKPVEYIRPVSPLNLSLLLETDQAVFQWLSGYQENTSLIQNLQYQLNILSDLRVLNVHLEVPHVVVRLSSLAPNTKYTTRVRSGPNQVHYKGVWSQWSSAIHWRTSQRETHSIWFALFFLLPVLVLVLSYSRCKRCILIQSPAPYIRDFKSYGVLPGTVGDLLQKEESLKIESMIEYHLSTHQTSPTHCEMSFNDLSEHTSITPLAPSTLPSMLLLASGLEHSSRSWLSNPTAMESGSVTCSEDYCTLSHAHIEHAVK